MLSHSFTNTSHYVRLQNHGGRIGGSRVRVSTIQQQGSQDLAGGGGRRVHFLVAIAYCGGLIVTEPYEKMTGEYFANFVAGKLPHAFINARMSSRNCRILSTNPCLNSKVAREALKDIGATLLRIPHDHQT